MLHVSAWETHFIDENRLPDNDAETSNITHHSSSLEIDCPYDDKIINGYFRDMEVQMATRVFCFDTFFLPAWQNVVKCLSRSAKVCTHSFPNTFASRFCRPLDTGSSQRSEQTDHRLQFTNRSPTGQHLRMFPLLQG